MNESKQLYKVDCSAYGEAQATTISEALAENRVVIVRKGTENNNRFIVTERCDDYFDAYLTREQLIAWSEELRALADT